MRNDAPLLIIDAKYKPPKPIPDRADLNQVVLYGARYSCLKVMLLYPERSAHQTSAASVGVVGPVFIPATPTLQR